MGDQVQRPIEILERHGLRKVDAIVENVHQVAVADRIPRIVDRILPEADVDAAVEKLKKGSSFQKELIEE